MKLLTRLSEAESESELVLIRLERLLFACVFKFRIRIPAFPFYVCFWAFTGISRPTFKDYETARQLLFDFVIALFRISDPTAAYDRE